MYVCSPCYQGMEEGDLSFPVSYPPGGRLRTRIKDVYLAFIIEIRNLIFPIQEITSHITIIYGDAIMVRTAHM